MVPVFMLESTLQRYDSQVDNMVPTDRQAFHLTVLSVASLMDEI
jgi:hypothetical protein